MPTGARYGGDESVHRSDQDVCASSFMHSDDGPRSQRKVVAFACRFNSTGVWTPQADCRAISRSVFPVASCMNIRRRCGSSGLRNPRGDAVVPLRRKGEAANRLAKRNPSVADVPHRSQASDRVIQAEAASIK